MTSTVAAWQLGDFAESLGRILTGGPTHKFLGRAKNLIVDSPECLRTSAKTNSTPPGGRGMRSGGFASSFGQASSHFKA
jgi:hypothetical protein